MTALTTRLRSLRDQGRSVGYLSVIHAALFRRLSALGLHVNLVDLGDDDPTIAEPRLPPGYTTRPVPIEELWQWVGVREGLNADFLRRAMERGDRCVGNFHHDELVGYGFVTRRGAPMTDQLDVAIDDWLIYRYKGWTHPEHRRKHLSHARGRVNRRLLPMQEGMRTVSIVAVHNLASKLTHADVHPVHVGYCGYVRLFGREYPFTTRGARRHGFRLERRRPGPADGSAAQAPR